MPARLRTLRNSNASVLAIVVVGRILAIVTTVTLVTLAQIVTIAVIDATLVSLRAGRGLSWDRPRFGCCVGGLSGVSGDCPSGRLGQELRIVALRLVFWGVVGARVSLWGLFSICCV